MLILEVTNVSTNDDNIADYSYVVRVKSETILCGRILGHQRELGWKVLVQRVLDDAQPIGTAS